MAAAEALIVLSLLGCDDSGAQCDFVRVGNERYETVEACRAASEPLLAASAEEDYPTVVAVCSPESSVPTAQTAALGEPVPVPVPPETPAEVDGEALSPAETAEAAKADLQPAPFPPAPPKAGEEAPQDMARSELAQGEPANGELPPPDGAVPPAPAGEPVLVGREPGLLSRVADAISSLAPEKETITKPIDVATDGAAKVGGAVIVGVKRVADAVNPF